MAYSTNNYYVPPQQYWTPQPSYQAQPYQQSVNTGTLLTVFVNSEQDVKDYPVAAGTTVLLLAFNLGKFYLKSTGTNGVPQQLREFTFKENIQQQKNQNDVVSREEFSALSAKLDKLLSELGGET